MADLQKVDTSLYVAWHAYRQSLDKNPDDGISISLRFDGDLGSIEALGFKTRTVLGRQALGIVKFKDLEALDAHPGVLWMAAGEPQRPALDTAVRDIKARASAPINGAPVDGLWHAKLNGDFTKVPEATGKGVFVAIIDSGIDYQHPMFMSDMGPPRQTRIFRIWDQGLTPTSKAACPPATLLSSGTDTYGVEYTDVDINAALNGGPAVSHRDCDGHGTHVAGIAAGGTKFPKPGGDAKFVGVAPEASIIVVKFLDVPAKIKFRTDSGFGDEVGSGTRLLDAVIYCIRTAKAEGKPVVINMSLIDPSQPGDGLDIFSDFFDLMMEPGIPEGPLNFPKSAVIVKAAGNEGDKEERRTAHIVVPATGEVTVPDFGEITVPLELIDTKGVRKTRWQECDQNIFKPRIGVHFWYRRATPFDSVKFALRLPGQATFSDDMPIGGNFKGGFVSRVGPPRRLIPVSIAPNVYKVFLRHEKNEEVKDPVRRISLRRHRVHFWLEPKETSADFEYLSGIYEIRIKGPVGTKIFMMCDQYFWGNDHEVRFSLAKKMRDGSALNAGIIHTNESSAVETYGRNVITVAAYDDKNGVADPLKGEIAAFSSRGPLRDFSNPPAGPIAPKPDIAAPGVNIMSAHSKDTEALVPRLPPFDAGIRFTALNGTSMATPIVTGVIALMLDKKPDLDTNGVRTALNGLPAVKPSTAPDSTNAYGKGLINALESYRRA